MSYSLIKNVTALEPMPDGSRAKPAGPYLSPSQVKAFERCESAYYASYAKGRREPGNPKLLLGTGVHRFAEVFHQRTIAGDTSDNRTDLAMHEAAKTIDEELAADIAFRWDDQIWYKGPTYTRDLLHSRTREAIKLLLPVLKKYHPIKLEQGYFIEWADGVTLPILSFTDLIAIRTETSKKSVLDYKTSGQAKKAFDLTTDVALTAYSIGEGLTTGSEMLHDVGYINVVTTKEMAVQELFDRRYEDDIRRLYNAARVQTLKLRAGLIGMTQTAQNCGKCWHRQWCVSEFGGLRPEEAEQADADAAQLSVVTPPLAA